MSTFLKRLACATVLAMGAISAQAQSYPDRAITVVVPYAPGGVTDVLARMLGEQLGHQLGQAIVVENHSGAGGNIGAAYVAASKPDGYTLLMMIDAGTVAPALYSNPGFDPIKSFAPITMLATAANLIVAHPSFPASNLQELIAVAKAKPNTISFASSGVGTSQHLGMERLKAATGMRIQHVPYKGGGQAINALVSDQVPVGIIGIAPALQQLRAGNLKALAITGARRSPLLPNVPTVAESGVPGFESFNWFALLAPAGTPAVIIKHLHDEVVMAMRAPGMEERLAALGVEVTLSDKPDDLKRFLREDVAKWPPIIKANHIRID